MVTSRRPRQADQLRTAAAVLAQWRWGKPDFPLSQPLPGWDSEMTTQGAPRSPADSVPVEHGTT